MYHTKLRQLAETLSKAFDRMDDPCEERARCVKYYMYKADGHSSDRAVEALLELMDARKISSLFYGLTSRANERVRALSICILILELFCPIKLICVIYGIPLTILSVYFFFCEFGWIFRASIVYVITVKSSCRKSS